MQQQSKIIAVLFLLLFSLCIVYISCGNEPLNVIDERMVVMAKAETEDAISPIVEETVTETTPDTDVATEPIEEPVSIESGFSYDIYDVICLVKLVQGEGGGLSKLEKSAIVWCALNYLDAGKWEDTIIEVVKSLNRFSGYSEYNTVTNENIALVIDVLERYRRECNGETDVGRTLPKGYLFFRGFKWKSKAEELGLTKTKYSHNWYFTVSEYHKDKYERAYWDWSLPNPYE